MLFLSSVESYEDRNDYREETSLGSQTPRAEYGGRSHENGVGQSIARSREGRTWAGAFTGGLEGRMRRFTEVSHLLACSVKSSCELLGVALGRLRCLGPW